VTAAGLVVLCALAWLYLLQGAGLGMSAWEATRLSLFPHRAAEPIGMGGMGSAPAGGFALVAAMWWVMMVAMMTPSAAPTILLYGRVQRHNEGRGVAPTAAFAAGYLLTWLGFSLAAAGLHEALERAGLEAAMGMGSKSRWLSAGVLLAAGAYQLSPLHNACLARCRSPAEFLARHWRPGFAGAVRLGALHGAVCVGCCWLLMGLLFVGGVMNIAWIAGLTVLVAAEKLLPAGAWVSRAVGVLLLVWGVAALRV
jgi:predicted metal-binding membrane protein